MTELKIISYCRYDQQLVICRDLEEQLDHLKEQQLKQFQKGNQDEVSQQKAEIENMLRQKDMTNRQQMLLNNKGQRNSADPKSRNSAYGVHIVREAWTYLGSQDMPHCHMPCSHRVCHGATGYPPPTTATGRHSQIEDFLHKTRTSALQGTNHGNARR